MGLPERESRGAIEITEAAVANVPEIVALHSQVIVDSYVNPQRGITEAVLKDHVANPESINGRTEFFSELIAATDSCFFVAKDGDSIVGFGAPDR